MNQTIHKITLTIFDKIETLQIKEWTVYQLTTVYQLMIWIQSQVLHRI